MHLFLLICVFLFVLNNSKGEKFKLCFPESQSKTDCEQLERGDFEIDCIYVKDWVECVHMLSTGEASFASFSAERALQLSSFKENENIEVLSEIRNEQQYRNLSAYGLIVVIDKSINSMVDLRNQKYYHPGFEHDEYITDFALTKFEKAVLKEVNENVCDLDVDTSIERHIAAISRFFGESCRPGPWTANKALDEELQRKYPKLCALCPNRSCMSRTSFRDALDAVVKGRAKVAVTTMQTFEEYRRTESVDNVYFMCNNSRETTFRRDMCTWVKQPWRLLLSNSDSTKELRNILRRELSDFVHVDPTPFAESQTRQENTNKLLEKILEIKNNKLVFINNSKNVKSYMQEFREIITVPSPRINTCVKDVRWCVSSADEEEKCNWLRQASMNRGIVPLVECRRADSPLGCLASIKDDKSDIAAIDANYGYMAKRQQLESLAYTEIVKENLLSVLIFLSDDSNIATADDLKGKQACFPEYGGLAWLSFIDWARQKDSRSSCDYGKFISNFLEKGCCPGVRDEDHGKTPETDEDKLCELCVANTDISPTAATCKANGENAFFNSTGVIQCLTRGIADFIVMEISAKSKIPEELKNNRILCGDGSPPISSNTVAPTCALSTTVDSEIVIRRDDPRKLEYSVMLTEWETWFNTKDSTVFRVFDTFNGISDLMFKGTAIGIDMADSNNPAIKEYVQLFEHIDACVAQGKDGAMQHTISFVLLITALFSMLSSILLLS